MKKEQFLQEIQKDAQITGSKANIAWEAAISIDQSDKRWDAVEEYYPVETFAKAFGVKLPVYAKLRKRMTPVERFEMLIARAIENNANPEDIAQLQKKLAQAKGE